MLEQANEVIHRRIKINTTCFIKEWRIRIPQILNLVTYSMLEIALQEGVEVTYGLFLNYNFIVYNPIYMESVWKKLSI